MNEQKLNNVLKYLNLDLKKIPKELKIQKDINIKSSDLRAEHDYKIYKYLYIKCRRSCSHRISSQTIYA